MFETLKLLRWDWRDEIGRFNLLNSVWMRTPGRLGFAWRNRYIPHYFAEAGRNVVIHEGVRFRGVHRIRCGAGVVVMPGVDLPPGCAVSAQSVVSCKTYPPSAVLAGHPARIIGLREAGESQA